MEGSASDTAAPGKVDSCPVCTYVNKDAPTACAICGEVLNEPPALSNSSTLYDEMLAGQLQAASAPQPVLKKPKKVAEEAATSMTYAKKFDTMRPTPPTAEALRRITADLKDLLRAHAGNASMFVVSPERKDITSLHSVLFGPADTPYEGGVFHFHSRFPSQYPWEPPMVVLRTTDNNQVRFGPNLYQDGKVCLSILGTWAGPSWTPVQSMTSVLLSILSLMNASPYHNEPGFEGPEKSPGDDEAYNLIIQHECIRVAVVGELLNPTWPIEFDLKVGQMFGISLASSIWPNRLFDFVLTPTFLKVSSGMSISFSQEFRPHARIVSETRQTHRNSHAGSIWPGAGNI